MHLFFLSFFYSHRRSFCFVPLHLGPLRLLRLAVGERQRVLWYTVDPHPCSLLTLVEQEQEQEQEERLRLQFDFLLYRL